MRIINEDEIVMSHKEAENLWRALVKRPIECGPEETEEIIAVMELEAALQNIGNKKGTGT